MIVYDKEQKQIVIPNGLGNVNIIINGGGDCPEQPGCNLGIGEYEFDTSYEGNYELYASDDGYDGWSKMFINIHSGAITVHRAANLLNGYDVVEFGKKCYVGGEITEIQEVIEDCYKTYVLDNGLKIYKGGWFDGFCFNDYDEPIKVGSYVIVYGVLQDNNGEFIIEEGSQVIAYQECAGGEGGSCNLEDKWVTPSMADRDGNNLIVVEESEGYDGLSRVVIDPQTLYNEGVEAGRAEGGGGGSCNLINPIVFSKKAGNTINAENVQIPAFVYEGNQYYNANSFNLADIEEFKIHILFKPNNSGDAEPVNIFGCEDTDWDNTTFGARIYQGQITFKMSGQEVVSPYTENAWYDVEMGYNTTKKWIIVNGETLLDEEYASFNRPRQTLMIGAINSGGNAFRPFYGKIAAIYIKSNGSQVWLLPKEDGTMGVYWNNLTNSRNSISGENNARFENDYISGDGMKSITWLGNLEDKWVTPSMSERDDNGYIVVSPSEGYNGLKRTVINPQTIYNEGVEAGRAEGGEGGGCTLVSRTFTSNGVYHPEAEQMQTIWFTADKPSAYDTGIKLVDDSWVEIYFSATEGGDMPTLIGCEEGGWNNTVFATRLENNIIDVKIGSNEVGIPYTADDGRLHKLKFGKTVGVWFDDVKVDNIAGEEWAPIDRTIYIGAMNDPSNNNENGFWRPWVGFIGDVTVYGSLNGNVAEYHFKAGDYGRWGEFKRVEDDTNLPNLGGDGMAIAQIGSYGEAPDGYNEITVNVPITSFEGTNHNDDIFHREAYWDSVEGYSSINIDNRPYGENKKEQGRNEIKANLKDLTITENNTTYTAQMSDVAVPYLQINGQRFLTDYQPIINDGYISQYGFEIIIKAKLVQGENNGGILIGTSVSNDFEGYAHSNLILRTNADATRLYLGEGWTPNEPTRLNEWVTYRITADGLYISSESNPVEQHIGWEVAPNIGQNSWDSKVVIGGLNTFYDGTSSELRYSGKIAKVEFKQAETYTYVPTESGLFLRTETSTELQTIDGEAATYATYTEKVGEYGWKKVDVNIDFQKVEKTLDEYLAMTEYDNNTIYLLN